MNIKNKNALTRAFAIVAGVGFSIGGVSCTAPSELANPKGGLQGDSYVVDNNSRKKSIKARDLVSYLTNKKNQSALSKDQNRLVGLARQAWVLPLGQKMLQKAAQRNITFTINNNVNGGGHYEPMKRAIEFKESTIRSKSALKTLYHELTHFYQFDVWQRGSAPAGTCSFDRKMWNLSNEAQADLLADIAMDQHDQLKRGRSLTVTDMAARYRFFTHDILRSSKFHRSYYNFEKTSLGDGKRISVRAYNKAFGALPEIPGNFLSNRFKHRDDIHRAVVFPDRALLSYYKRAGGAVNVARPSP